jgi:hypothetical protein
VNAPSGMTRDLSANLARCPSCSGTEKVQMNDGDFEPCHRCMCRECGAALPEPWAPCAKCGAGAQS